MCDAISCNPITQSYFGKVKIIFLIAILCGLTFPSVRISLAALLESASYYLYDSAKKEKTFIPYWLKKVKND
tara:strand:- start:114 stop:329 length:216 start_codon:yes stop_codon:yes gene_type:complete